MTTTATEQLRAHRVNAFNRDCIAVIADNIQLQDGTLAQTRCDEYTIEVAGADGNLISVPIVFHHGDTDGKAVGVTNEALLAIVLDRLSRFQSGPYRCRQNALAITKLEEALHWLRDRAEERDA